MMTTDRKAPFGAVARRRALTLGLAAAALAGAARRAAADPLDAYAWRARPLILFIDAPGSDAPARQRALLSTEAAAAGLRERQAPIFEVGADAVTVDGAPTQISAAEMRAHYNAPKGRFQALLVGKDTGVKLRSDAPVTPGEVFALIDGMPMRRREMRERP